MEPQETEELISRWRGALFSAAYAELGSYADAEDAVAEALVRIVKHGGDLRDPARFAAWARRIAVNEARRIAGRRKSAELPEEPTAKPSSDLAVDIRAALDSLPASLASTLSGYYLSGESVAQLSHRLQVPEGTIKWRLSRGRGLLKATLKGYEPMEIPPRAALLAGETLSPSLRRACTDALQKAGWSRVACLSRFADAALLADTDTVGIVLDEWIEGRSAFELIPLLRALPERRILLLLDKNRPEAEFQASVSAAYVAGVDMLLSKPFSAEAFAAFARRLREGLAAAETE